MDDDKRFTTESYRQVRCCLAGRHGPDLKQKLYKKIVQRRKELRRLKEEKRRQERQTRPKTSEEEKRRPERKSLSRSAASHSRLKQRSTAPSSKGRTFEDMLLAPMPSTVQLFGTNHNGLLSNPPQSARA